MAIHVLDDYYLAITLLVTIGYQLLFFSIAFTLKFDKLTDFAGGTNFTFLAILTLAMSQTPDARQILASLFIMIWATRLSGFLLFRILKTGKDDRFDDKRDKFWSFLGFWVFQMIWVWTVSLPVTLLNSPRVQAYSQPGFGRATDVVGIVLWTIGFLMEAISDVQKYRYKTAPRETKPPVCDKGFWAFSRHPNYAGEILVQFSIYILAVTPAATGSIHSGPRAALYASILGPLLLTTLLLFVSGLTLQERPSAAKQFQKGGEQWSAYARYLERTSILIPLPPALWSRLPVWVKRTVGLEFPMYVFVPEKHADQDALREREQNEVEEGRQQENHDTQAKASDVAV